MHRLTLLALVSLLSLPACATESPDPPGVPDDGHADSLAGKRIRVRFVDEIWMLAQEAVTHDVAEGKSKVIVDTNDAAIVEGNIWVLEGTAAAEGSSASSWHGDRIMQLVASKPAGATADVKFMLLDVTGERWISCKNARGEVSAFTSIAIDLVAQNLHADSDLSFSFNECGLASANLDNTWLFGAFPMASSAAGPLVGTHPYTLTADLL